MSTTEPTTTNDRSAAPLAWVVTLVLAVGLTVIVVIFAFSQSNTPASIDGTTATTSQFIE